MDSTFVDQSAALQQYAVVRLLFLGDEIHMGVSQAELEQGATLPAMNPQTDCPPHNTYVLWTGTIQHHHGDVMVPIAWRTHAEGYLDAGLATALAIDSETGLLHPMIDKSRDRTDAVYTVATEPGSPDKRATARVIPVKDDLKSMPTFALTGDRISPAEVASLEDQLRNGSLVGELGALAKTTHCDKRGAAEVMRRVLHTTIGEGKGLFVSMVHEAREGLVHNLSQENLRVIGEPTVLEANKYRRDTVLWPLYIDLEHFIPNILEAASCAPRAGSRARLLASAVFFSEGLPEQFVPAEVAAIRKQIGGRAVKGAA